MIDNVQKSRFEHEEDGLLAFAEYRRRDGLYLITHVETDPALRGKGAASRLMEETIAWARAGGVLLQPRCSFARTWFEHHPEDRDVLG